MSYEIVFETTPTEVVFETTPTEMVFEQVGARGAAGADGAVLGSTFSAEAGATIFGGRVVRIADGVIDHPLLAVADHADQVIGISTQSGSLGASLIVHAFGRLEDGGWTWAPGAVYCGDAGVLTQTPPSTGWVLKIGKAVNPTTLFVDIDDPFFRS